MNRSLRKVKSSKVVGKIGHGTVLKIIIATALRLPSLFSLNHELEITWSDRYALDALFFSVKGKGFALLLLADVQSLDVIEYEIAEFENYESWKRFLNRVKSNIIKSNIKKFFVTDGKKGLHQALNEIFPDIPRQLCISHKQRRINQILPQVHGSRMDRMFGHFAHKAIGAKDEKEYWVYHDLLREFLKSGIYNKLSPQNQNKLKRTIGAIRYQRKEQHTRFRHPKLIGKDTTTNILEGINGFFKERLKLMRGMKKVSHVAPMIKLLIYYYRFHIFSASCEKCRNGKRPIELNNQIDNRKLSLITKGKQPFTWIINLTKPT